MYILKSNAMTIFYRFNMKFGHRSTCKPVTFIKRSCDILSHLCNQTRSHITKLFTCLFVMYCMLGERESFPYVCPCIPKCVFKISPLHHLTTAICALCVSGMTALVIFPFDWPSHNVISVAAVWKGLLCSIWAMPITPMRPQLCF